MNTPSSADERAPDLLPCPFCDEDDGEVAVSSIPGKFSVYCNGCFSEGPPGMGKAEAAEAWNHRASLGAAQVPASTKDNEIAAEVVQRVCDYDDRTSPEEWPEMLMITGEELRDEVLRALAESREASAGAAQVPSLSDLTDEQIAACLELEYSETNEWPEDGATTFRAILKHAPAIAALSQPSQQGQSRPSSLDEQIAQARAEVATWSPEKRASVRLEGGTTS